MAKKTVKKTHHKAASKPKAKAKPVAKKPAPKKKAPTPKAKSKPKPKPVAVKKAKAPTKPKAVVKAKVATPAKAKPVVKAKPAPVAKPNPVTKAPVLNSKPVAEKLPKPPKVKKPTAKEIRAQQLEQQAAAKAAQEATIENRIRSNPLMNFKKKEQYAKKPPVEHILPEEANRLRYSDEELEEFREIIISKLEEAKKELNNLTQQMISANENGTDDTAGAFKMLEEGSENLAKEEAGQLAQRQKKFIEQLEAALMRIENKTYGICVVTGKLIPKARLRAVPHTTKSIEAKLNQYRD